MLQPRPCPPPPGSPRRTKLLRAAVGRPVVLASAMDALAGFDVHFEGRSYLCRNVVGGECPYCRRGWHKVWKGFLLGYAVGTTYPAILEVPAGCARDTKAFQPGQPTLLGARIDLLRVGPHANSDCVAHVQYNAHPRILPRPIGQLWAALQGIFADPAEDLPAPVQPSRSVDDVGEVPC